MKILGIEHVGVAVEGLEDPARVFHELLGISRGTTEEVPDRQVITESFDTGAGKVELLKAVSGSSPITRFLQKKGPGIHHIAFVVDDIRAWLEYLEEQGVELVDQEPREGAGGCLTAFLHPRSTAGILLELYQRPQRFRTS
ncbi:methylmalonyl-CoA epimerase [Candidatus Neomarinimicrobiota bacterium]